MHWESDAGSCRKEHQSKFTPSACLTCHRGPICVWYRSVSHDGAQIRPQCYDLHPKDKSTAPCCFECDLAARAAVQKLPVETNGSGTV
jgi:hypothetical protein